MSPELAARRTSAAAVLGDYHADVVAAPHHDCYWSERLALELGSVLAQLAHEDSNGGVTRAMGSYRRIDGVGELAPDDVLLVLGALVDAYEYRRNHADARDMATATAYRALGRALGDDR